MPDKPVLTKEERSARRAARRENQRRLNLGRAEKMRKARLEFVQEEKPVKSAKAEKLQYYIGCSGWYYWHWAGQFYPAELPRKDWFSHYSSNFDTVELNAPFYSWPTIATVKTWLKQAGERKFIYTVKVSELITHIRKFQDTKELVQDFSHIADMLGPRMGCFLFQLPPSVHYSPELLQDILSQLDHTRRNVVEFRHASWWNEEVYAAFREKGTIFCACSGPRLPDDLVKTADDIYVRFHGTSQWYRHEYSQEELAVWVRRIKESGAKNVWAYFNNDIGGHAIHNAKELLKQLQQWDRKVAKASKDL
ncbi:MAG: hypothetical protein JWM96_314 [Alphaproteobacteria bacterium]|nr:hypothetical protein [Alphaproteobacteria bacterium]